MGRVKLILVGLVLCFLLQSTSFGQSWLRHTIDSSSSGADGVKLGDINGDGLPDIVTGWEEGGITRLYLYPGAARVKEPWPAVTVGTTPDVEDAAFVDMDGDGKLEIVSCTEGSDKKIYVHWSQSENLLDPQTWRQEVLPASARRMRWMYAQALPIDGKNGGDLVAGGKDVGAGVGWFESPDAPRNLHQWQWHPITPAGWIMSILVRDMDRDGDNDIVITDRKGTYQGCRWLENPGMGQAQKSIWRSRMIGGAGLEVMFMAMVDTDGDGIEEAVITEKTEGTIRIFKRRDKQGISWEETTKIHIPDTLGSPKSVEAGDINGDGIADLVYSTETKGLVKIGLAWIDGRELNQPAKITFHSISGTHIAKYDKAELLDMDQDGDLDVLICEENYGENSRGLGVIWYENPHK